MATWSRSAVLRKDLDALVSTSLLCPLIDGTEWIVPGSEPAPERKPGYIVSFIPFHERGVATPPT